MTHPTTEQSIRERLARAAAAEWEEDCPSEIWLGMVDAILAEMENPSEGMKTASDLIPHARDEEIWRAMIRHIRDGGK